MSRGLPPLQEELLLQAEQGKSLAHITQRKTEAQKAYDRAMAQLETFVPKTAAKPAVKKARIIKPAKLVQTPYLATEKEVKQFLAVLEEQ
ncbi:hypothetical protein [Candidatus Nitrospira salsa]